MKKTKVAIDIGSSYIKVLEGFTKKGTVILQNAGIIENPVPNVRAELNENDQSLLAGFLKDFLARQKITGTETICGIGGKDVVIHYFDIPDLQQNELQNAVELEAPQVIPGGCENLEYDYQVMSSAGRKTVLFAGYTKQKSSFFVDTLVQAGLKPLIMDLDATALLNAHELLVKKPDDIRFILDIGGANTTFCLGEPGGFSLVRHLPFGGEQVTTAIRESLSLPRDGAEQFKKNADNHATVGKTVLSLIEDSAADIETGIQYFHMRTQKKPSGFFLTGGSAVLPELQKTLEERLEIPGTVWNPLEKLEESPLPVEIRREGRMFAAALGLLARKVL